MLSRSHNSEAWTVCFGALVRQYYRRKPVSRLAIRNVSPLAFKNNDGSIFTQRLFPFYCIFLHSCRKVPSRPKLHFRLELGNYPDCDFSVPKARMLTTASPNSRQRAPPLVSILANDQRGTELMVTCQWLRLCFRTIYQRAEA